MQYASVAILVLGAVLLIIGATEIFRARAQEAPEALQAPPEPDEDERGECLHPTLRRIPAPGMGRPNAFFCTRCRRRVLGARS